jgi:hypothetical protein
MAMDTEEFTQVRDLLRAFAERWRVDPAAAGALEPGSSAFTSASTEAQKALAGLGLDALRAGEPPTADVQQCALLAEVHGEQPLGTSFLGTVLLAPELLRLLGVDTGSASLGTPTVALGEDLRFPVAGAVAVGGPLVAWDACGADRALAPAADGTVTVYDRLGEPRPGADLLREIRAVDGGGAGVGRELGRLEPDALRRWQSFALVVLAAELVGGARSFTAQAVEYARERVQYRHPIGSYQAVQHLLADATVAVESATGAVRYAAWSLDHDGPSTALRAARVAKAEADASAAEAVRTGMQVYGGIAQTWEHPAHLYLRRTLAGAQTLATGAELLGELAVGELAVGDSEEGEA